MNPKCTIVSSRRLCDAKKSFTIIQKQTTMTYSIVISFNLNFNIKSKMKGNEKEINTKKASII